MEAAETDRAPGTRIGGNPIRVRDDGGVVRQLLPSIAMVLAVACATPGVHGTPACDVSPSQIRFGAVGPELHVQLATDEASRATGLMGVNSLPADEGMAFTWDGPTDGTFWMKDTLIPLSIAFVGADGKIVTIAEMTPCQTDPCPTYAAEASYTMAVEANAGWFADHGIEVGDRVTLRQVYCS